VCGLAACLSTCGFKKEDFVVAYFRCSARTLARFRVQQGAATQTAMKNAGTGPAWLVNQC
jgi:hypothetical protein